jgi:hypothetical protein
MTDEKNESEIFEPKNLNEEDRSSNKLIRLLSTVQQGWKVSLIRTHPSWCRGHLETIEIFDDVETIDIDYIIRVWGGQRIHLKVHDEKGQWLGGTSVSLFTYQPKRNGKVITMDQFQESHLPAPNSPVFHQAPSQLQPPQSMNMAEIIKLMQSNKNFDLGVAFKFMEKMQPPQAQPQFQNPMEQMMSMFGMFKQFQEMMSEIAPSGGVGSEESIMPMVGELVKGLMANQAQSQRPPVRSRPSITHNQQTQHTLPKKQEIPDSLSGIADKLASLGADDAAHVVSQALNDMPEDKRGKALQAFFENMTPEDIIDNSSIPDNDQDQDDDQSENYTPPYTGQ